jgi:hypothetical protein
MTPNTPEDVSDERLAELIKAADKSVAACVRAGPAILEQVFWPDMATALRELQRHRAENNELDAKRYRTLRKFVCYPYASVAGTVWKDEAAVDSAIDSAMSNASEEGR